jgi:hypothetical protein
MSYLNPLSWVLICAVFWFCVWLASCARPVVMYTNAGKCEGNQQYCDNVYQMQSTKEEAK